MCVGDATKCFNKCMPEMVGNLTNDGSSGCQQANKCNEIYLEENEKINQCISVCTLENKVVKVSPITFPLGLLLLVLMGTISLNFYQESVGCPLKCTRPWYREVPGRVLVYGSMSLATVLVILIISLLGGPALALNEQASMGFAIMMVFVLIFVFNIGLIATSLIGRCCIAQDTTVAEASSESDEGAASSSSPSSTIVVVGAAN